MGIERVLERLFNLTLRLYPPEFRGQFGQEMACVFVQALEQTGEQGAAASLRLFGRELLDLPGRLIQEHWASRRDKEVGMNTDLERSVSTEDPGANQRMGWSGMILAALPYILIWVLSDFPRILVVAGLIPRENLVPRSINVVVTIFMAGILLVVLVSAWRRGWPLWWASWTLFYGLLLMFLLGELAGMIIPSRMDSLFSDAGLYLGIPLIIAFTLYAIARFDRLGGILAALPAVYYLWQPQMEFVPDGIETAIETASTLLVVIAVLAITRLRNWRSSLWIALGVNLLVGLQFSYAGIYHGGALSSTAPGPSPLEVVENFVPIYLVSASILLGPLLARMFRDIGHRSDWVGHLSYHIALGGLLVLITANLTGLMLGTSTDVNNSNIFYSLLGWPLYAALLAYALGVFFLYRSVWRSETHPGLVQGGLLATLPLCLPLTFATPFITWKWPVSEVYGVPLMWVLPDGVTLVLGGVWLVLAVWLVTRGERKRDPLAAVPQPG